jgi:hypothetical protein
MNDVEFVEVTTPYGVSVHAVINRGNGEFTTMLKSTYDEMIAKQAAQFEGDI